MRQPRTGDLVHYVLGFGPSKGQHRPAIVVRVWGGNNGCVQLQVFTDGGNDALANVDWRTSILPSEEHDEGTWHWPEND